MPRRRGRYRTLGKYRASTEVRYLRGLTEAMASRLFGGLTPPHHRPPRANGPRALQAERLQRSGTRGCWAAVLLRKPLRHLDTQPPPEYETDREQLRRVADDVKRFTLDCDLGLLLVAPHSNPHVLLPELKGQRT